MKYIQPPEVVKNEGKSWEMIHKTRQILKQTHFSHLVALILKFQVLWLHLLRSHNGFIQVRMWACFSIQFMKFHVINCESWEFMNELWILYVMAKKKQEIQPSWCARIINWKQLWCMFQLSIVCLTTHCFGMGWKPRLWWIFINHFIVYCIMTSTKRFWTW